MALRASLRGWTTAQLPCSSCLKALPLGQDSSTSSRRPLPSSSRTIASPPSVTSGTARSFSSSAETLNVAANRYDAHAGASPDTKPAFPLDNSKQQPSSPSTSPEPDHEEEAPRNPLGVQLLSPRFSRQIFPPSSSASPPLHPHAISLSQAHLAAHGLSPSQGSKLTSTYFPLPPLQGKDLGEHFWNIGREAAQPWLSLAEDLAASKILEPPSEFAPESAESAAAEQEPYVSPSDWISMDASLRELVEPRDTQWLRRSGWCRYPVLTSEDGTDSILGDGQPVPFPDPADGALVFDVETMTKSGHFAVMACAVGSRAWYAWISPWLLGETEQKDQLIPFGGGAQERLLVGHYVSYDRARVRDEYQLQQSNIRFLDTLSLHVAVRGMSSPQRPVWIAHRKKRAQKAAQKMLEDEQMREDQRELLLKLLGGEAVDATDMGSLSDLGLDLEALWEIPSSEPSGIPLGLDDDDGVEGGAIDTKQHLQWLDISSTNSLADVASLYCDVKLPKEIRNIFVEAEDRHEILQRLELLLNYCARDVSVTHAVFAKVLPAFRENCPHPATFAGVLALGSPILPVDDEFVEYQERCQEKYEDALKGVRTALIELAEGLRTEYDVRRKKGDSEWWQSDPWLSQLDWTPKKPRKSIDEENSSKVPRWYRDLIMGPKPPSTARESTSHLLLLTLDGQVIYKEEGKWLAGTETLPFKPLSKAFLLSERGKCLHSGIGPEGEAVLAAVRENLPKAEVAAKIKALADSVMAESLTDQTLKETYSALDWTLVNPITRKVEAEVDLEGEESIWPQWYWELFNRATGLIDLTIRTRISPLLLKTSWRGCPLYYSREHGWVYRHRVSENAEFSTRQDPLVFEHEADASLQALVTNASPDEPVHFYKVPHSAGDKANVGSPFSKSFVGYFEDSTLRSEHPDEVGQQAAKDALDLNAQCSYWVGVRDRVAGQMVVWDGEGGTAMGIAPGASGMRSGEAEASRRKGLILPQVTTMGTITRRAMEKTWLTASNAKKNRVGSELKAMVKAPPGWVIVGADVDSEELWICSVMGDAQFGLHGATAVGWMTLEGTKSAGTDLHSKTASILGTSRNQAKIFNYSRIYGAGIRHATQLLLKANPAMLREEATRLAKELYASTKGNNTGSASSFGRRFWFGGTESFVFNKLEEVALSKRPRTPALDCGITAALSREFLPKAQNSYGQSSEDFMPSRINWVVQSSGVDYLHLLITSMTHLCRHYDIAVRFMISVHDELRYLAKEEDAHRAALALQIANVWTRAMFAYKLQMEDLPEGVAWFAQVDVDKVLRKEVYDPCVTPSQPNPIPSGQAYEIAQTLEKTHGGSLYRDGRPMGMEGRRPGLEVDAYPPYCPSDQTHRSLGEGGMLFLQAQASNDIHEIRALARRAEGLKRKPPGTHRSVIRSQDKRTTGTKGSVEGKVRSNERKTFVRQPNKATPPLQASSTSSPRDKLRQKPRNSSPSAPSSSKFSTSSWRSDKNTMTPAVTQVSSSFLELTQAMPVRRKSPPVRREVETKYWQLDGYQMYVRWYLYRQLLRTCPLDHDDLKGMIQRRTRRLTCKKIPVHKALKHVLRGEELLGHFKGARNGDPVSIEALREESRQLEERHRLVREGLAKHAARQPPKLRPIVVGSLLRPSFYNPPLLRLKPQPINLTGMIASRRLARIRRLHRGFEIEQELSMLQDEGLFYETLKASQDLSSALERDKEAISPSSSSSSSSSENEKDSSRWILKKQSTDALKDDALNKFGTGSSWFEPLLDIKRQHEASYILDEQRRTARFSVEQLLRAKAARRARLAVWTKKKQRRREEKEKASSSLSASTSTSTSTSTSEEKDK